jgi:hypothetical protein
VEIEPKTVRLRSACFANSAIEAHGASVHTTARRIHACGKHVPSAIAIPVPTWPLHVWARGYSPTLGRQPPNTQAATQTHCIARLSIDYEGNRAPAGTAQWMGFEPPQAQPDGLLVHYSNHSVTMLPPPEHNYPKQTSQVPTIAKVADHCSRRNAHPMRGIMSVCIPIANSREWQQWG